METNDEALHNLDPSSNIIGVIKSRMTLWVGHVDLEGMEETRNAKK
jgi:hypothetical protein